MAETLARLLDVPFAIADATTLTEAGYVGEDVENIIQKLLQKCDYDVEKAQVGIVYIDEIDKIWKSDNPSITRDVLARSAAGTLKLIEGTVASVPPQGGRNTHSKNSCRSTRLTYCLSVVVRLRDWIKLSSSVLISQESALARLKVKMTIAVLGRHFDPWNQKI